MIVITAQRSNASNHLRTSSVSAKTTASPSPGKTRNAADRLIEAAAVIFARDGLGGATTREIAREAGVNEVTLFRKFQTKQNLLAAVLEKVFDRGTNPLAERFDTLPEESTLREILTAFAEADHEMLMRNVTLMRVMVGEIHRFEEHERMVLRGIFKPRREQLARRLREACKRGEMREDVDPVIVIDQLVGMIFTHAVRSDCALKMEYGKDRYLKSCVEMVLRTIAKDPAA